MIRWIACGWIGIVAAAPAAGAAATGGTFDLNWHSIDCGGGASSDGAFSIAGTVGQHDVGQMSGGGFTITGGLWGPFGESSSPTCPADLTGNGIINAGDLAILLGAWSIPASTAGCAGMLPCDADLTGDSLVNAADLAILLGAWGACE